MGDMSADSAVVGTPVDPTLFTMGRDPRLIGSQCAGCGVVTFPRSKSCSRCTSEDMKDVELPKRGTLWSWTIQGFLPKSPPYAGPETPATFKPYGVGYIQLEDKVIVESRLTTSNPDELKIGMEMELVIIPFNTDADGNEVVTYAFAPVKK